MTVRPPELDLTPGRELDGALCAETDPELFFPGTGEHQKARAARRICGRCPVQLACLRYALNNDERFGVWGGLTPRQRTYLRKWQRGEGR